MSNNKLYIPLQYIPPRFAFCTFLFIHTFLMVPLTHTQRQNEYYFCKTLMDACLLT